MPEKLDASGGCQCDKPLVSAQVLVDTEDGRKGSSEMEVSENGTNPEKK